MPLAVAEPDPATPFVPIVFALIVPLTDRSNGEPAPGVAICNVMALPFAPDIVLLETLKVNVPPDAIVTPPPPTLLFGWLFDNVFGWPAAAPPMIRSIVLWLLATNSTRSPGAPVKVLPLIVAFRIVPALRDSTDRLSLASMKLWFKPNCEPVTVSRFSVP